MKISSRVLLIIRNEKLFVAVQVLLFLLCCTIVLIVTSALPLVHSGDMSILFLGLLSCAGSFFVAYLFVRWNAMPLASSGVSFNRNFAVHLGFGFLVGTAILGAQWAAMWACGHVHWERSPVVSMTTMTTTITAFIFLSAREEIAFHGFALRQLSAHFGLWPAQLGISIMFALEHVVGGNSWLNALAGAGMGSLLFGMAAIATRGLAIPVGMHAAWNTGDWLRGGKTAPGAWHPVIDPGYESYVQISGLLTYMLLVAVATSGFWMLYRARQLTDQA